MKTKSVIVLSVSSTIAALSAGCVLFSHQSQRHASSVVEFLYPRGRPDLREPSLPVLSLPLRVGIAFVPEDRGNDRDRGLFVPLGNDKFSEERKVALMQTVSEKFKRYPFVKSIDLIPSNYLRPQGSFANLDQLRTMYGVDVMALVSYDQVQFTDDSIWSLGYWTVVGMYTIPGEKNDTQTMLDTAVYDVASRKLLFRAPGTSRIKMNSTPTFPSAELRQNSEVGFDQAATNLSVNLEQQLEIFKSTVKKEPEQYKVVTKPGYAGTGMGAVGWPELLGGIILASGALISRSRKGENPALRCE